jgi:eukaryotic-like serine/threonine-protein kinase
MVGRTILGQFAISRLLWDNAFGAAYLADQPTQARRAVVFVLAGHLARDPEFIARSRRDGPRLQAISHLVIPRIFTAGVSEEGLVVLASEHVAGKTLGDVLRAEGPQDPKTLAADLGLVGEALQAVYAEGFVHGALSPEAILLTEGTLPPVRVLETGVAWLARGRADRAVRPEDVLGAWPYLAPEIWKDPKAIDARTDVYALAATAYHALAGRPPYIAKDAAGFMSQHCLELIPPLPNRPGAPVPPAVEDVIRKGLAKKRDDRFKTPAELVARLAEAAKEPGPSEQTADATRVITISLPQKEETRVIPQTYVIPNRRAEPRPVQKPKRRLWPVFLLLSPFVLAGLLAALLGLGVLGKQKTSPAPAAPATANNNP